jgi:hypothetical protein
MRVADSKSRLMAFLRERGIKVGPNAEQGPESLRLAWEAFKSFAAIPVASGELTSFEPNDDFLYEFGTYDWGDKWGKTFQVDFVRQYGTADGDIQQVRLAAYYPASAGEELGSSTVWGSMLGGSADEQRQRWIESVESSPAFQRLLSQEPLGYEVWQGSAE